MGASKVGGPPSKEQYIEIIKNKIGLLGAVTDEQKIAYLENEKKILDAELAKGDNGKYGKDWAQSRNGFYGFNMGKAREESALIRSDYVKNTSNISLDKIFFQEKRSCAINYSKNYFLYLSLGQV